MASKPKSTMTRAQAEGVTSGPKKSETPTKQMTENKTKTAEVAEVPPTTPAPAKKAGPITPAMKLRITKDDFNKTTTYAAYLAETLKKYPSLEEPIVKKAHMASRAGLALDMKDYTAKQKTGLEALMAQSRKDFVRHAKNKILWDASEVARIKAEKEAKEAEKQAHKQQLAENESQLTEILTSNELIVKQVSFVEEAASSINVLTNKISFDEKGDLVVSEDAGMNDFRLAFARLISASDSGIQLTDRSAKAEAAVGYAAKNKLGDTYTELFAGRSEVLARVKRGIRVFETVKTLGRTADAVFKALPLNTSIALLEMKVTTAAEEGGKDKADAKNLAAKKEVMRLAALHLNEKGKMSQKEALNIVSEYKKGIGITSKERHKFFHLIADADQNLHLFGMPGPHPDDLATKYSMLTIDYNGNRVTWTKPGEVNSDPIEGPTEDILKLIRLKHDMDQVPAEESDANQDEAPAPASKTEKATAKKKGNAEKVAVAIPVEDEGEDEDGDQNEGAPVTAGHPLEGDGEVEDGDEDVIVDGAIEIEDEDDEPVVKKSSAAPSKAVAIPMDDDEEEDDDDQGEATTEDEDD